MQGKELIVAICTGLVLVMAAGCEREGPAERAGEQVDRAAEGAGERVEEATEK